MHPSSSWKICSPVSRRKQIGLAWVFFKKKYWATYPKEKTVGLVILLDGPQRPHNPVCSLLLRITTKKSCAILSLIDYTLKMIWVQISAGWIRVKKRGVHLSSKRGACLCSGVDLVGPYCHTHNYSPLPIHYVDRAGRRRRGKRTKAEDKVVSPMCWVGLGILIKK